jgi:hypothetical protein
VTWNVTLPTFISGSSSTFDLSTTLPSGIVRGGLFTVDSRGAPLPSGMTMTSRGILSVGSAGSTRAVGVIFSYAEP